MNLVFVKPIEQLIGYKMAQLHIANEDEATIHRGWRGSKRRKFTS